MLWLIACLLTCESTLGKVPPNHSVAGVFMLIDGGDYTMNFTAAAAACLVLNVTMATKAQLERAVQLGLETCKYGWIQEKVAAIPRLKSDNNCGRGGTGVVTWATSESKAFAVFCFNASDLETTPKASTAHPQSSTSSTQTPTPTTALTESAASSQASASTITRTTKAPDPTSVPSALTPQVKTTPPALVSSTSPPLPPLSTRTPTPRSQPATSNPTVVAFTFSTVVHDANVTASTELPQTVSSAKPSPAALRTGLITLGIILLLLTAAGAALYHKLSRNTSTCWYQRQQDDVETEMWKHSDSEMGLHSQHEEEESNWTFSSEIMLCVNPDIKANSSE
ncbi:lymphatic vessel endothelial hyaluronic receptor 1b isoform X2 [Channa argus]|uniref:lymphatic vessel endothelial hyaluronic receptor 1b isoform X2 n=1 Tax=Channa argus TaxID=215402 RepID=UPI0035225576